MRSIKKLDTDKYQLTTDGGKFQSSHKEKLFNNPVRSIHFFTHKRGTKKGIRLVGWFIFFDRHNLLDSKTRFSIVCNDKKYPIDIRRRGVKHLFRVNRFVFLQHDTLMPYHDFADARIHNSVYVQSEDEQGYGFTKPIRYNVLDRGVSHWRNRRVRVLPDLNTTIYIKQNKGNTLGITARRTLVSDKPVSQILINIAWILSRVTFWRRVTLIYEKESARYEESGSVLYEELLKKGYRGFRYVIDKKSEHFDLIPDEYQSQLVYKNSFRHYYYFFLCDHFVGTEMPPHAVDIRIANRRVLTKLEGRNYDFVFLQHGVYYMVSMGSKARGWARKENGYFPTGRTHIVVSSELEAQHFIEEGGFSREDLYIVGLPKFDRAYRKKDASRIVIMPTWRPWEYNAIRTNPESTPYYKMLLELLNAVPDNLKETVQILPHPLFIRELKQLKNSPISDYIKDDITYDEVLRDTDLLITDYSSIAYDAFYRGSNVIFWWKEKEYCMEQYGGHLKINENNIWGDIVYDAKRLSKLITTYYNKEQPQKYVEKYRKIVEFHDNRNTERLIKRLLSHGIISPYK